MVREGQPGLQGRGEGVGEGISLGQHGCAGIARAGARMGGDNHAPDGLFGGGRGRGGVTVGNVSVSEGGCHAPNCSVQLRGGGAEAEGREAGSRIILIPLLWTPAPLIIFLPTLGTLRCRLSRPPPKP